MDKILSTLPRKGWEYGSMEDLGDVAGVCEFCGTPIRYVHYISHDEVGVIGVGCICCDNLTESYKASDAEAEHKRDLSRIGTLMNSSRWYRRKNGYFIHYRGYKIIVWDNGDDCYCLQIRRFNYDYYYWRDLRKSYHASFKDAVKDAYYFVKNNGV